MAYLFLFFRALGLTVLIECLIAGALRKFAGHRFSLSVPLPRLLGIVALASCLTLPYVWFVFPEFIPDRWLFGLFGELFALLVETLWYFLALRISFRKAFLLSFITNLGSFLIGLLLIR
jgi:hypothetical protein